MDNNKLHCVKGSFQNQNSSITQINKIGSFHADVRKANVYNFHVSSYSGHGMHSLHEPFFSAYLGSP